MTDDKFFETELKLSQLWAQQYQNMSDNLPHLTKVFSLDLLQSAMNTGGEFLQKKEKSQHTINSVTKSSTFESWRVFEFKSQKQMKVSKGWWGIKVCVWG